MLKTMFAAYHMAKRVPRSAVLPAPSSAVSAVVDEEERRRSDLAED